MGRWLRQFVVVCLAVAMAAGGVAPLPMPAGQPVAQGHQSQDQAAAAEAGHHLAMAAMIGDAMASASDGAPCHGMAMPCTDDQSAADHQAPACPNMMLCCIGAVPGVPGAALGLRAPLTAGTVLALALERTGDGHIPSPLPKIPRA